MRVERVRPAILQCHNDQKTGGGAEWPQGFWYQSSAGAGHAIWLSRVLTVVVVGGQVVVSVDIGEAAQFE